MYVDFQFSTLGFDALGGLGVSCERCGDRSCYLAPCRCVWLRAVTQLSFDVLSICKNLCEYLVVSDAFRRVSGGVEFFLPAGKSRDLNQAFSSSYGLFVSLRSSLYFCDDGCDRCFQRVWLLLGGLAVAALLPGVLSISPSGATTTRLRVVVGR